MEFCKCNFVHTIGLACWNKLSSINAFTRNSYGLPIQLPIKEVSKTCLLVDNNGGCMCFGGFWEHLNNVREK